MLKWLTITEEEEPMQDDKLKPIHPGEVLLEEFLKPMNLSQNQLALALRVPTRRINEIVHGKRRITADTALRLARYFNMSPRFWLGLQMDYDLDIAEDAVGEQLKQDVIVLTED
jgi:addiction module HigA family antidote